MNIFTLLTTTIVIIWCFVFTTFASIVYLLTFSSRIALWLFRRVWGPVFNAIVFIRTEIKGQENVDFNKTHVYFINHQSFADVPVAISAIKTNAYFILKKELRFVPLVGWFAWFTGMIFVDRSNKEKALVSIHKAAEKVNKGKNVIIFPEGTRSTTGRIEKLKRGGFNLAVQAGVPIVPVVIEGTRNSQAKGGFFFKPAKVKLRFGKPISTKNYNKENIEVLRKEVSDTMVDMHKSMVREIVFKRS